MLSVFFGVAGGLLAFGLVGLFVGPLIQTVLLAIWREWLGGNVAVSANAPKQAAA